MMSFRDFMWKVLLFFTLSLLLCNAKQSCTHFLGKYYSLTTWKKAQERIDCINCHGSWQLNESAVFVPSACHNAYMRVGQCPHAQTAQGWKYHWVVDKNKCHHDKHADLSQFDAIALCRVMGGRHIMIVGDSISNEFAITLLNAFAHSTDSACSSTCSDMPTCQLTYNFKCQSRFLDFKLHVIRNDRISLISNTSFHDFRSNFHESPWIDTLRANKDVSLLIFNRGSHFEETEKLLDDLEHIFTTLHSSHPNITVLWRNTYAGHVFNETDFFGSPWESEMQASSHRNNTQLPFHWFEFHEQNNAIRELVRSNVDFWSRILYWNIEYLMSYRIDMIVRDFVLKRQQYGLHYCIPGPIDNWPKLMVYMLTMIVDKMPHYDSMEECQQEGKGEEK